MKTPYNNIIQAFIALVIIGLIALCLTGCASFSVKPTVSVPNKVVISVDKQEVKDLTSLVNHQFTVASVKKGVSNTTTIKLTPTAPYNGFFWIGGVTAFIGIVGTIAALLKAPTIGYKWSLVLIGSGVAAIGLTAFIKVYGALLLDVAVWSAVIGLAWFLVEHNKTVVSAYLCLTWSAISAFFVSLWQHFFPKKPVTPPTVPPTTPPTV